MGRKLGTRYHEEHLCPYCDTKPKKSLSGLAGHIQLAHSSEYQEWLAMKDSTGPAEPQAVSPGIGDKITPLDRELTNPQLEAAVKQKKLLRQLRDLSPEAQSDVMSAIGLGTLAGQAKQVAQLEALKQIGLTPGVGESWVEKIAKNPEILTLGANALKGVLGINPGGGGNTIGVVKEFLEFYEFMQKSTGPTAPSGLKVGGISIEGATLTSDLLDKVLDSQEREKDRESRERTSAMFADGLDKVVKAVTGKLDRGESLGLGSILSRGNGAGQEEEQAIECLKCGTQTSIPLDLELGAKFPCANEACDAIYEKFSEEQQPPQKTRRPATPKEPEKITVSCPGCSQSLDVTERELGEKVECPACSEPITLISEVESIPAVDLSTGEDRRSPGEYE